jgi:hypothetical protein
MSPPAQSPADPVIPTPYDPHPAQWGRRIGIGLVLLLIAAVGMHWLWGRRAAKRLAAQVAVYRAAGEPVTVEELNAWPDAVSGSGENALTILRAAGNAVDDNSAAYNDYFREDQLLLPLTGAEVAMLDALSKENRAALLSVDDAATKSRIDWELAMTSPMVEEFGRPEDLTELRRLTNVLHADGMLARHRGDDVRALRRAGQILYVSRAAGHHPTLIAYLVSVGMAWQAADLAAQIAPDLDLTRDEARRQAKALVAELLDERAMIEARRRGLLGERVLQLDTVASLGQGRIKPGDSGIGKLTALGWLLRPVFFEDGQIMAAHMTATASAAAESPDWPTYQAKAPSSPKYQGGFDRHLLPSIMLPNLERAAMNHYRALTYRRLAATCLAARLYAADHDGKFPETLQDLVPTYLPAVPLDPFAAGGKTLAYVNESADADDPRVYSVGENGIDNGGIEVDPNAPRRQTEKLRDEIRHFKRQPRPKPPEFQPIPGMSPDVFRKMFPGVRLPPGDEEWDLVEGEPAMAPLAPGAEPPPATADR